MLSEIKRHIIQKYSCTQVYNNIIFLYKILYYDDNSILQFTWNRNAFTLQSRECTIRSSYVVYIILLCSPPRQCYRENTIISYTTSCCRLAYSHLFIIRECSKVRVHIRALYNNYYNTTCECACASTNLQKRVGGYDRGREMDRGDDENTGWKKNSCNTHAALHYTRARCTRS